MNMARNFSSSGRGSGFVNMSAMFSEDGMYVSLTSFARTRSRR